MNLNDFIREHPEMSNSQIAQQFNVTTDAVRSRRNRLKIPEKKQTTEEEVKNDREKVIVKASQAGLKEKNEVLMRQLAQAEVERDIALGINPKSYQIKDKKTDGKGEAMAFMVASDWHMAERIDPEVVNEMNDFNPDIARERANSFFRNGLKLVRICQKDIEIKTLCMPLLGDLVNNNIHPDAAESNYLDQASEVDFVESTLISGIEYLLKNSDLDLIIPCHSGNHARTSQERRVATEAGNSLEWLIYNHLARYFRGNPRVDIRVHKSYLSYMNVFDKWLIRFSHGHNIRFAGGVGGVYIPLNKAVNQYNKLRHVYLDVLGHFHTFRDGGNFILNGSLCGFNAFAISIKADFEEPRQAFFIIDKKRGKTITAPILLNE